MFESPRILLWLILASFVVAGILEPFAEELWVVHMFVLLILLFAWCKADVKRREITEPTGSAALVALISIIGVPLYFFRSMSIRSAVLATLKAVGFLLLCVVGYLVPYLLIGTKT